MPKIRKTYVPSPEVIERRRERDRIRGRAKRAKLAAAREKDKKFVLQQSDLPAYKITARRMQPKLPANISKAELREMLAQACANTAKS
jgi:hypothetical protein